MRKVLLWRHCAHGGPGNLFPASSNRLEAIGRRCLKLGETISANQSYDISVRFRALPKIPIILNFNDVDELMSANAGFLYRDTAATYLDFQCLTITCTYLTGLLIQNSQ